MGKIKITTNKKAFAPIKITIEVDILNEIDLKSLKEEEEHGFILNDISTEYSHILYDLLIGIKKTIKEL